MSGGVEGGAPAPPSRTVVIFCLGANIVMAIAIVLLNKIVYTYYGFPNITMTCIHFVCTSIGMFICRMLGMFKVKSLPISQMLPISLTFCGFVVLTNLSLQQNTVGTYQIIKCLTMPVIMIIQTIYYARTFSIKVKLTLIPITVGVFLNSYFDLKFNLIGVIIAFCGVLVTSVYQVWVAEKQKELSVNAMQLLYYQAPLSAVCVAFIIPFFEPVIGPGGIIGPWSFAAVLFVALTGIVAFGINLSIYWIIGNTSPLTYNMIGHLKFSLTLVGGFLIFHDPVQLLQFFGICFTFSGVILYTHFKMAEQEAAKRQAAATVESGPVSEKSANTV